MRPPNAGRRFPAEPLTAAEVLALVDACGRRGPSGIRNRALIVVMWRAGLRVAEALALEPKDVDRSSGTLTILSGKGAKRRTVGLDPQGMAVLERWLELRSTLKLRRGAPVFCVITDSQDPRSWPGRPMRTAYVRDLLKRLAERAGIEKRVHPHALRHTHAFELAMENTPVNLIRDQLGHNSLSTTDRYLRHIAPAALVQAIQARPWPEGVEPAVELVS